MPRCSAAVDSPANGVTFCTGSLGARPDNDLPAMLRRLRRPGALHPPAQRQARRARDVRGSFYEAEHLGGDTDMVAVIAEIIAEERRRAAAGRADVSIPFRPDHGQDILDDLKTQGAAGLSGDRPAQGPRRAARHHDRTHPSRARTARMTPPYPVALVGVGKIARDQHIPAIAADPDFTARRPASRATRRSTACRTSPTSTPSSPTARRRWWRSACRRRPAPRWR